LIQSHWNATMVLKMLRVGRSADQTVLVTNRHSPDRALLFKTGGATEVDGRAPPIVGPTIDAYGLVGMLSVTAAGKLAVDGSGLVKGEFLLAITKIVTLGVLVEEVRQCWLNSHGCVGTCVRAVRRQFVDTYHHTVVAASFNWLQVY
jgi:hypothetical protein